MIVQDGTVTGVTIFADLPLARRLESAEGHACRGFAEARLALAPASSAAWFEIAGTIAVYDGANSPITQTFCLGMFEEASDTVLQKLETFFLDREAPAIHEVSPLSGIPLADRLCARGYRPIEYSSVLFQALQPQPPSTPHNGVRVRIAYENEADLWADTSAQGWAADYPAMLDSIRQFGLVAFARPQNICFLAEHNQRAGAAGMLFLHEGVALFGGAATIPELRRHGLQAALLQARLTYALDHGCDLAMMVTEAGSQSQRNAERAGFGVAYTRTKWRLSADQRAD